MHTHASVAPSRTLINPSPAPCDKFYVGIAFFVCVGKTVLTYRLMKRDNEARACLQERQSTWGVHHERWELPLGDMHDNTCSHLPGGENLVLVVWDYAGEHEYRGTQCFFTRQALYLVVFDLNTEEQDSAVDVVERRGSRRRSGVCTSGLGIAGRGAEKI
jgi:hypothetical protein